jgi:FlgD Ig-like domain
MLRFRSSMPFIRGSIILVVTTLALVRGAQGADPQSVLTIRGSCDSQGLFVQTPERPYLIRLSSPSSDLHLATPDADLTTGEIRWFSITDVSEDFSEVSYSCASGEWTGDFLRVPDAPTSFSGVGGASRYGVDATSVVMFRSPTGANYVASVQPRQGTISVLGGRDGRVATFASPGTYDLAFARQNDIVLLDIEPRDGTPAIWDVSISPTRLSIDGAGVGSAYSRPGRLVTTKYSISGDAELNAAARGKGRVVRQLAAGTKVAAGSHSLVWDGLDGKGKPVADGTYSISLVARDIFDSTAKTAASVTMDTHGPRVIFQSPRVLPPRRGVVFKVVDLLSGYRSGFVKVDGRSAGFQVTETGANRFVVRSPAGWTPGSHRVTVTAFDRLGNRTHTSRRFRAR